MPHGQQVQICETKHFLERYDQWDREHIFKSDAKSEGPSMVVDTPEDLQKIRRLVGRLDDPITAGLHECLVALSSA